MTAEYENLLDSLIKDGYLRRPEIIEAFRQIDRQDFVTDESRPEAYLNVPLSIGFEQTISQPIVVAFMIELLEPKIGEKILEIGSGSGWQTTILSRIVSQNGASVLGKVIGLERVDELREFAEKNVEKYGFIGKGVAKIIKSDGSKGFKDEAPFGRIIAGAASEGDVPEAWKKQLKIGGRIVAPVNQSVFVIDKTGKNKYNKKEYFGFSFVPLVEG